MMMALATPARNRLMAQGVKVVLRPMSRLVTTLTQSASQNAVRARWAGTAMASMAPAR